MKKKNNRITSYFILSSLLLIIGVGYAILQANLQINGTTKISNNTWDVHFDHIQVNSESVSIGDGDSAATIDSNNNCKVDFSVTLGVPGDYYEFTVDVVNGGSIDAMVGSLIKELKVNNVVVDSLPSYLNYVVTYSDGGEILENHLLSKNTTTTLKVRMEYKTDIDELPAAATITTSVEVQYVQADSDAISRNEYCTFDGEMIKGAEYQHGIYTYRYQQIPGSLQNYGFEGYWTDIQDDGWGVILTKAINGESYEMEDITEAPCVYINNKPIVSYANMFFTSDIRSIDVSSWKTSQVKYFDGMFVSRYFYDRSLHETDYAVKISGLDHMDVSSAINMYAMFGVWYYDLSYDFNEMKDWDVSHVTNFNEMFSCFVNNNATFGHDIVDMDGSLSSCNKAYNATPLNNWNINNGAEFSSMFRHYSSYSISFPTWNGEWYDEDFYDNIIDGTFIKH